MGLGLGLCARARARDRAKVTTSVALSGEWIIYHISHITLQ